MTRKQNKGHPELKESVQDVPLYLLIVTTNYMTVQEPGSGGLSGL
jgi:hypothetical protein